MDPNVMTDPALTLTASNAAALPIIYGATEGVKYVLGGKNPPEWVKRITPMIPFVVAFALAWIPGVGLAAPTVGSALYFAFAVGGGTSLLQQGGKKTIMGRTTKDGAK